MSKNKAIVLFSGGQDSTTALYWAKKKFDEVYAVCFFYGQKHIQEIEAAMAIAQKAEVELTILDANFISHLSTNALTNSEVEMESGHNCPNTFVPGRNLFFLSMAAVFAREREATNLVAGVSEADYSGYPDCRADFIKSATQTINLAMDSHITIHTPLMDLDKAEVWELSDKLGIFDLVRLETITCYNGVMAEGCGHCPACTLRNKGLSTYLKKRETA